MNYIEDILEKMDSCDCFTKRDKENIEIALKTLYMHDILLNQCLGIGGLEKQDVDFLSNFKNKK